MGVELLRQFDHEHLALDRRYREFHLDERVWFSRNRKSLPLTCARTRISFRLVSMRTRHALVGRAVDPAGSIGDGSRLACSVVPLLHGESTHLGCSEFRCQGAQKNSVFGKILYILCLKLGS